MFKVKIYCNEDGFQYWEDGYGTYETYYEALCACYRSALQEFHDLEETGYWYDVNMDFKVANSQCKHLEDNTVFPVAVTFYDKAPWERENDCHPQIITGYYIMYIVE